jgi:hypothetical protein
VTQGQCSKNVGSRLLSFSALCRLLKTAAVWPQSLSTIGWQRKRSKWWVQYTEFEMNHRVGMTIRGQIPILSLRVQSFWLRPQIIIWLTQYVVPWFLILFCFCSNLIRLLSSDITDLILYAKVSWIGMIAIESSFAEFTKWIRITRCFFGEWPWDRKHVEN